MMKKWLGVGLLAIFLIGLMAGCGKAPEKTAAGKEPVKLKIAHSTWIGYGPLYIAKEQGFFTKYGVDPEFIIMEDESQYANMIFSNEVQGLSNVIDRETVRFSKDIPEKLIFVLDESSGGDGIIAGPEVKTLQDLKGKTVGLDKGTTSYFFFLTALGKAGVNEKDVNTQEMSASDAGSAFVAGKLDAAVTWEPWLTNASQRQGGHSIVTSAELPKTIVDCIVLREDFVKEHPEAARGLAQAWYDAVEFYKQNPEKGNEIMAKGLKIPVSDVQDMVKGVKFYDKAANQEFFDKNTKDNIFEVVDRATKFWVERNIMEKSIKSDDFISSEIYKGL